MIARRYTHIVFDWNGTIVDDVALAVRALNDVRESCALAPITRDHYRRAFDFPIEDFYRRIGFDFAATPFATLAQRYLATFNVGVLDCPTHDGVDDVLAASAAIGATNWILSASHRDVLLADIGKRQLGQHFRHIAGLDDHHAAGKHAIAADLDMRMQRPGRKAVLIGDTLHDFDIAVQRGWDCLIVPNGHQDEKRLQRCAAHLRPHLRDVADALHHPTAKMDHDHVA